MTFALTRRTALFGTAATLALAACTPAAETTTTASLDAILEDMKREALALSPEFATSLAVTPEEAGGPFINRLSDLSPAGLAKAKALTDKYVGLLSAVKEEDLDAADKVSRDVVLSTLRFAQAGQGFGYGDFGPIGAPVPYVVTQLSGSYNGVPDFLASQHPVKDAAGADAWLDRLTAFAGQLNAETDRIKADAAKGVIPPDFVIDRTLGQMKAFAATDPAKTVLVTGLVGKVREAGGDLAAKAADYETRATTIVRDTILPAYNAQIAAFEALRPQAVSEAGIHRLPQGPEFYKAALAAWTTTARTPDEIHQLGLDLVASISAEMDTGLKALGYTDGTVAERMRALAKDPKYIVPNTDAAKEKLIADLNRQVEEINARLPEVFATMPKAKVEVKRVPAYIEAGAPGGYYQPAALDGSRPGAYYINLRDTAEWPTYTLPTLNFHEANPGHHFQNSVAQEAGELPFVRRSMLWLSGYGEGWALYVEQVMDEIGIYKDDPAGRLGYLQSAAFRATRLVVDTGMHHKKWTRQQAIDYMAGVTGDEVSAVTTEIERYCVWPGQACAYMIGKLEILDARERARKALGDRFDIKGFHDAVLLNGAVPLNVMQQLVDTWVASVQAG